MSTKHFQDAEFRCKDGCGVLPRLNALQMALEELRVIIGGKPIPIVSGYRCCPHNTAVGGAKRSRHTLGEAADIPRALKVTVAQAQRAGFKGMGTSGGYVTHVDVRRAPLSVWKYD